MDEDNSTSIEPSAGKLAAELLGKSIAALSTMILTPLVVSGEVHVLWTIAGMALLATTMYAGLLPVLGFWMLTIVLGAAGIGAQLLH